jgi:hypothetical protein
MKVWKELELSVRVVHFVPGRPATFYDPAEPYEIEWEFEAPPEVQKWLLAQMDDDDLADIESDLIDLHKEGASAASDFARAVEHELSQWDRARQRQADFAYDPMGK